jgi:hypothetical protein
MKRILKRQGMGLVALMVALAVIGLMCFFALRSVKKTEDATANQNLIKEAGVDTSSYKGILDSTQKTIKDAAATRAQTPQ